MNLMLYSLYTVFTVIATVIVFKDSKSPYHDILLKAVSNKPLKFVTFFLVFLLSQLDIYMGLLAGSVFFVIDSDIREAAK